MSLANEPIRAVPKPSYKRFKPTAAQRGLVNKSTRHKLKQRSKGLCERCGIGGVPLEAAHTLRRWKVEGKTTINELVHLCIDCHRWADNTSAGRQWLLYFRELILEESK